MTEEGAAATAAHGEEQWTAEKQRGGVELCVSVKKKGRDREDDDEGGLRPIS